MKTVKRRRSLRVVLGVVLTLSVRTVVAAPVQVTEEIRAVSHCASHMDRPVSVPESRRCCHVSAEAGAPATLAAVPVPPTVAPFVIAPRLAAVPHAPSARAAAVERPGERDGPPLHLALRVIRC